LLAAHTDNALRRLADKGDRAAQTEMVRRGLAVDPAMESERRKNKRQFRVRQDWAWR
jgi:hypothetical protein